MVASLFWSDGEWFPPEQQHRTYLIISGMNKFYTLLFILFLSFDLNAQVIVFSETFNEPNGSINGTSAEGIPWAATFTGSGNMPVVSGGLFRNNNSDGVSTWLTGNIDISQCQKLEFSMDYTSSLPWAGSGNMEYCLENGGCACDPYNSSAGGCANNWDFIYLEIILDGSVVHTDIVGIDAASPQSYNFAYSGPCFTPGDYNFAQIKVMTQTWAADEIITFDNVRLGCYENINLNIANIGPFCVNDSPVTLNGTPSGGVFSGAGVSGNQFNPSVAGPGVHEITYTYNQGGCPSVASIFVQVNPLVNPTFSIDADYCINESPATLPGTSSNGISGSWSPAVINTSTPGSSAYTFTPNAGSCANPFVLNVTVNPLPTVTLSADPVPLCEGDDLTLHAGGGTSYQWSGPNSFSSNNPDPVITGVTQANAGTYSVTVTDGNGCENTGSINITVDVCGCVNPPVANAGSDDEICADEIVMLNGSVNTTAQWTTSGDGTFADPANAVTTYTPGLNDIANGSVILTLTANDPDGPGPCIASTDQLTIQINANPTGTLTGNFSLCPGACNTVQISINGGSGNYQADMTVNGPGLSYSFTIDPLANGNLNVCSTGAAAQYISATNTLNIPSTIAPGVVTFTINSFTDGISMCAGTLTSNVQITLLALPEINIDPAGPLCLNGASVVLSAIPAGGSWSGPGVTGNTFSPASAGAGDHVITYSVDQNGCMASSTITVTVYPAVVIDISPISPLCADDTPVTLSATPASGNWSGNGVSGGIFDPALAGPGTHTITYTVTDGNGCDGSASIQITVNDCGCADPAMADAGPDQQLCDDSPVILSGTVNTNAIWSTSGSGVFGNINDVNTTYTPSAADIAAGTIILTLTAEDPDGAGPCSAATDQLILTFAPLTIDILPLPDVCQDNGFVLLNADPAGGSWSGPGLTGNVFDPAIAGPGTHNLTYVVSQNGCDATETVQINVHSSPVIVIDPIAELCLADAAVSLSGTPAGGSWSGPGVSGNTFDPVLAGPGNHAVTYTVTDVNGCEGNASVQIIVNDCGCNDPAIADAGPDLTICAGQNVQLSGMVNTNPLWTTNGTGTFDNPNIVNAVYTPSAADIANGTVTLTLTAEDPDGNGPCSAKSDFLVLTFTSLNIIIGPVNDLCEGNGPVGLNATPAGGSWSGPGVTGNTFDPVSAGPGSHTITYEVTENGCTGSAVTTIQVNALPAVTLEAIEDLCKGDAAITLVNGMPAGGQYFINGDLANPVTDFNPATVGTFQLTYIYQDAAGCTNSAVTDIHVLDCDCDITVTVDAGPDQSVCSGSPVNLNGQVTGVSTATWSTSGDGSFNDLNDLNAIYIPGSQDAASGSVILTLTSEDPDGAGPCSPVINTMIIHITTTPDIQITAIPELCSDDAPVTMTASPAGGNWSGPGINGNQFDPQQAGIGKHKIYYTAGAVPCQAIDSIVIDVIDCDCSITVGVDAGPDLMICAGRTVNLNVALSGVPAGSWTTSGTGIFSDPNALNAVYTPSQADIFKKTIVLTFTSDDPDGSGPCKPKTDIVQLTIISIPDITLLIDQPDCNQTEGAIDISFPSGNSLVFSTDGGQNYTNQTHIAGLEPGNYTLYIKTAQNECIETLNFAVNEPQLPAIDWRTTYAVCTGSANSLILTGGQNLGLPSRLSINGQTPLTIQSLPYTVPGIDNGSYRLSLIDGNGCEIRDTFDFEEGSGLSVSAQDLYEIRQGESVTLETEITGSYQTIEWTPADFLNCTDCPEPVCIPEKNNSVYTIKVTDENGCSDEAEITIRFRKELADVFIPNTFSPNDDGINDCLTVYTNSQVRSIKVLRIYNRWGAQVFERKDFLPNDEALGWDGYYRGQQVNPDVYVYYTEVELFEGRTVIYKGDITVTR